MELRMGMSARLWVRRMALDFRLWLVLIRTRLMVQAGWPVVIV